MVDTTVGERAARGLFGDDLAGLIARYRRYVPLVAGITIGVFILSILVTFLLKPLYTAEATVVYAPQKQVMASPNPATNQAGPPVAADAQDQAVDTETAVLQSPDLALEVEARLGLDKDPEFIELGNAELKPHPGATPQQKIDDFKDAVAVAMLKRSKVTRVGQTFLVSIDFTSENPVKAARIANAFAQAYLDQQLAVKIAQGQQDSKLIGDQLASLRKAVQDADEAVQQYRISHNLMNVSSNNDTGAQTTIVQQEVVALNDQMALARADAAGARAGLNAAQQQLRNGGTGETVGAAIESPVIAELRRQYAEASRNVASMETIYGPDYPDLVGAKSERDDIAKQIHEQVDRILSSLQSQASVAEQRMASIQASLNAASAELAAGNVAAVQLADLQRTADSANSQYQAFLASANAVNGQNVVAHPDARISTPASVPVKPSFPIMILDAAVGLVLGAIIGAGVAFVLDQWSANSATMEDVERNLGVAYAGALPTVKSSVEKPTTLMPINAITAHPLSSFAESFRNLAAFLFYSPTGEPVKVLAVASALPKEGKTTTAICLARVMAMGGSKVLLMDCDLRRRSATEAMSAQPKIGLIEVLDGKATLEQALQIDKPTGAYFLPLTPQSHLAKSPFESKAMDALLARLRGEFDVIVLDTAPVLAVVDTRMLARKVDAMVMLVTWRATPSKAVRAAIHLINSVGGTVTGAALTMVNLKAQSQSGYGDPSAYYNDIKGYYSA